MYCKHVIQEKPQRIMIFKTLTYNTFKNNKNVLKKLKTPLKLTTIVICLGLSFVEDIISTLSLFLL